MVSHCADPELSQTLNLRRGQVPLSLNSSSRATVPDPTPGRASNHEGILTGSPPLPDTVPYEERLGVAFAAPLWHSLAKHNPHTSNSLSAAGGVVVVKAVLAEAVRGCCSSCGRAGGGLVSRYAGCSCACLLRSGVVEEGEEENAL